MKKILLTDVEVYPNCFLCSIKDYKTKEIITWEISDRKNDLDKFTKFWKNTKDFIISFNGISYDNSMILFLLKNKFDSVQELNKKLKKWSDYNINTDFWSKDYPQYKYHNQWTDIDLLCYWSKGLRISKKISLKSLAIQLNWDEIQELPYPHDKILSNEEIDNLIRYNVRNDLGILEKLTNVFNGKSDISLGNLGTIKLRSDVSSKYNINAWSFDAPKIAAEVLSLKYCEKTGEDIKMFKSRRFDKETFQFKDLFKDIKFEFETSTFKNLYDEWMNSSDTFSKEFAAFTKDQNHGIRIAVGMGGINTCPLYKKL